MDEIIATVEVLDGINIEVEDSTSEISAEIEEVNEISLEAFDYPPEVEAIHVRLDDIEEMLPEVSETAEEALQTADQALEDAATADGKAVAAQGTANANSDRLDTLETLTVESFSEPFTMSAAKANTFQNCTSAIDVAVTFPLNETANKFLKLPVAFEQAGNGVVSIVGAVGVTVLYGNKTAGQGKHIVVVEKAINVYAVVGGVE